MGQSLYTEILSGHLQAIERALPQYLAETSSLILQKTVVDAMSYACSAGGKRIRPVLLLEFCRICKGNVQDALPFACALEMIHSYSLVHDDLPCMDNSPMRRGKPSVHAVYGEDMALLTGDALLTYAFETILQPSVIKNVPPDKALAASFALAKAAGISGMVGGQVIDLQSEGRDIPLETLEALQLGKTAALLEAACEMGALLGNGTPEQIEAAKIYGRNIGLCFQIVDDMLDCVASAETLGKPAGSDAVNQKVTYVSLLGMAEAKALAARRTDDALAALAMFDNDESVALRQLSKALLIREK